MARIFILARNYNRLTDKILAKKQIRNRLVLLIKTDNLDRPHIDQNDPQFDQIKRHFQIVKYRRASDPESVEMRIGQAQLDHIPPSPVRIRPFFRRAFLTDYAQEPGDIIVENKDPLTDG